MVWVCIPKCVITILWDGLLICEVRISKQMEARTCLALSRHSLLFGYIDAIGGTKLQALSSLRVGTGQILHAKVIKSCRVQRIFQKTSCRTKSQLSSGYYPEAAMMPQCNLFLIKSSEADLSPKGLTHKTEDLIWEQCTHMSL